LPQARCRDLSGIGTQLEKEGVKQLVSFLRVANSPYVRTFSTWAVHITEGLEQAQSNLKFLEVLKGPCTELAAAEPQDVGAILPGIVDLVRLIQLHSGFYNGRQSITGLYIKVSQSVLRQCSTLIDLADVFTGDITEVGIGVRIFRAWCSVPGWCFVSGWCSVPAIWRLAFWGASL
jgi:dynein heavy chain